MSIIMFDSTGVSVLPAGNYAYAGYVNGRWATYPAIRARFPRASVLSIAVSADADADCLDIETGDAAPQQAPGWVARQAGRGVRHPCLYASVSVMNQVLTVLAAARIPRDSVRLWSAHYGVGEHICGPASCTLVPQVMDGTQWTDAAQGKNLDQSLLADDFFEAGSPLPQPGGEVLTAAETAAILNLLPVLSEGAADAPSGKILFVHRMQLLISGIGAWNALGGTQIAADGVFGPQSAAALKTVQGFFRLAPDGICGPQTWRKLITG